MTSSTYTLTSFTIHGHPPVTLDLHYHEDMNDICPIARPYIAAGIWPTNSEKMNKMP